MSAKSESSFLLSKWYADLVDPSGNLLIIYIGRICFGGLNIYYSSILKKLFNSQTEEKYSVRKYSLPEITDETFRWKSKDLMLEMKFIKSGPSYTKELINLPEGFIRWECLQARSHGEVITHNNEVYRGLGYVERLDMTIKPWKLPFNELRWGRFTGDENSAIWIDYKGQINHSLVLLDNKEFSDAAFFEDKVVFNGADDEICLSYASDIRKGEIISSTFSKIPVINKIIPSKLFKIYEHKSLAKASLCSKENALEKNLSANTPGGAQGWAIFEVVKWI